MSLPKGFDLYRWNTGCGAEKTNDLWRRAMALNLRESRRFEIHCWKEEAAELRAALAFGREKETDWQWGRVVEGPVTPEFAQWLLELPKPADTGVYNKMTPFFSIFLDNGFYSSHYGTELGEA